MVNKCIVQGNLVRDPELKQTNGGTAVCNFTIAMSEKFGEQESKLFLNCTAWKKQADTMMKHFKKGDNVLLVGKIWTNQWTDKEGKSRKENRLDVHEIHFTSMRVQNDFEGSSGFAPVEYDEVDMPF